MMPRPQTVDLMAIAHPATLHDLQLAFARRLLQQCNARGLNVDIQGPGSDAEVLTLFLSALWESR